MRGLGLRAGATDAVRHSSTIPASGLRTTVDFKLCASCCTSPHFRHCDLGSYLSRRDSDRIERAVERLAVSDQGNIERLKGFNPPEYRLRVGVWQVRYCYEQVDKEEEGISVVRVLHRREAYRKSALIRQDIPGPDGFDETGDCDMQDRFND